MNSLISISDGGGMGWFQSNQEKLAESLQEEQAYALAAYEIANGETRPGLWAKAFAEATGNEQLAQGIYIKLRAAQVKLGVEVTAEMLASTERAKAALLSRMPVKKTDNVREKLTQKLPAGGTLQREKERRRLLGYDAAPDIEIPRKVSEKELKRRRLLGYDD